MMTTKELLVRKETLSLLDLGNIFLKYIVPNLILSGGFYMIQVLIIMLIEPHISIHLIFSIFTFLWLSTSAFLSFPGIIAIVSGKKVSYLVDLSQYVEHSQTNALFQVAQANEIRACLGNGKKAIISFVPSAQCFLGVYPALPEQEQEWLNNACKNDPDKGFSWFFIRAIVRTMLVTLVSYAALFGFLFWAADSSQEQTFSFILKWLAQITGGAGLIAAIITPFYSYKDNPDAAAWHIAGVSVVLLAIIVTII